MAIGSVSIYSSFSTTTTSQTQLFENTTVFDSGTSDTTTIGSAHSDSIHAQSASSATPRLETGDESSPAVSSSSSSPPPPPRTTTVSSSSSSSRQLPPATTTTNNNNNAAPTLSASMGFEGRTIPECCCSFCEIEEVNRETVYPLLKKVVETPFFSHFKIDLCSTCELWDDAPLCRMKDCSVCECEAPPEWSFADVIDLPPTGPDPESCDGIADDTVVTAVDSDVLDGWGGGASSIVGGGAGGFGLPFLMDDGDDAGSNGSSGAQVVDLLKNPEGYTGYTGPSAEKVWSAIHSQNCFQAPTAAGDQTGEDKQDDEDQYCSLSPEQRLYNRFISGLHSSISLHIAHSYCLEMDPHAVGECRMWGPNDAVAYERVLDHPDRVENLYVAFSLLLRAVVKAEHAIAAAVPTEDPFLEISLSYWRESLLPELLALPEKAPATFDESTLLKDLDLSLPQKRAELQRRFRQLQSIMRCVGCDRCKLWGTLQTLGVGTALRVLFHDSSSSEGGSNSSNSSIFLTRQEAVALVNTLERLSSSLVFAQEFRARKVEQDVFSAVIEEDASCASGGN